MLPQSEDDRSDIIGEPCGSTVLPGREKEKRVMELLEVVGLSATMPAVTP